jgi:DNA-binding response OmpR family regulator
MTAPRVAILAQDLIWQDRLSRAVQAAGGEAVAARSLPELERALDASSFAIVDLTARTYDGLAAIARARQAGARVLGVGQHDDVELRKQALAAGAWRVLAYRKLFEDGPAVVTAFLGDAVGSRP